MKYFIDTEFIEEPNTIQLISIGIVAEDGREYYAISKDFDLRKVWNDDWLRQNVLLSLHSQMCEWLPVYDKTNHYNRFMPFNRKSIANLLKKYGTLNEKIAEGIIDFINTRKDNFGYGIGLDAVIASLTRADCWNETFYPREFEYIKKHNTFIPENIYSSGFDGAGYEKNREIIYNQPEFYGYFADYDWVVFCWLFGKMKNLPKGFPMYCRDIKQMLDANALTENWKRENLPDPEGEHNALTDARWNKQLYDKIIYFINH